MYIFKYIHVLTDMAKAQSDSYFKDRCQESCTATFMGSRRRVERSQRYNNSQNTGASSMEIQPMKKFGITQGQGMSDRENKNTENKKLKLK